MSDWIMKDLKFILRDGNLLSEFVKLNDKKDMYEFCNKTDISDNKELYTEKEFTEKIEKLIDTLPNYLCDNNEW